MLLEVVLVLLLDCNNLADFDIVHYLLLLFRCSSHLPLVAVCRHWVVVVQYSSRPLLAAVVAAALLSCP